MAFYSGAAAAVIFARIRLYLDKTNGLVYLEKIRAVNSAVECHPHTVEVTGSNPVPPTNEKESLAQNAAIMSPFGVISAFYGDLSIMGWKMISDIGDPLICL
jgi:hypothetical protein